MFAWKICNRIQHGLTTNCDFLERYDGLNWGGRFWWRVRLVFNIVVMMRSTLLTTWWRGDIGSSGALEGCEV